jgi:ribosome-associated heat shock protein Hsp15
VENQPFWAKPRDINELSRGTSPQKGLFGSVRDVGEWVMNGVRMDAWLWAARFFKTRTLAKKACELGRIQTNGNPAKAAREVRVGTMLRVINEGGEFEIEVLGLSEVRGPAVEAQKLYRETETSKEMRQKVAAERRAAREFEILPAARPSKRDRRRIIQFRGRG